MSALAFIFVSRMYRGQRHGSISCDLLFPLHQLGAVSVVNLAQVRWENREKTVNRYLLGLTIAVVFVLSGCASGSNDSVWAGGDDTTTTAVSPPTNDKPSADDAVRAYFDAIASKRAGQMDEAMSSAGPGSPAELYLRYQAELSRNGIGSDRQQASYVDGVVSLCFDTDTPQDCQTFEEIVLTGDGRIEDFRTGSKTMGERIKGGGEVAEANELRAELILSYETFADDLWILVDTTNSSEFLTYCFTSRYLRDGRQIQTTLRGESELEPGFTTLLAFSVSGGERGGTLRLDCSRDDTYEEFSLDLLIP